MDKILYDIDLKAARDEG